MSRNFECPAPSVLQQLLDGDDLSQNAAPWTRDLLERHVAECGHCQSSLEALVAGQQSWEDIAKQLAGWERRGSDSFSDNPALRELMENQKHQYPGEIPEDESGPDGMHRENVSLGFLKPSDDPSSRGRLGSYEILEVVGQGGMGLVLKAYDPSLRRIVAIKVMATHLASSPMSRKRFIREARAAAAISHDHVVAIFAVEENHEPPFLVMQFVEGKTLQERLRVSGPLSVSEILRIGMQTAAGLAAAHAQGLVHRDIKPANILLENGVERVKITDFGLARAVDDVGMTQTGVVAGTPQFMAPEQANGEPIDLRSDLFSLGSVMYMLSTGGPPFRATTTMGLLKRICEDVPRPIQELNPDIPDWLAAMILKLLEKRPADRYQSAKEVSELLEQWLAHVQSPTIVPAPIKVPGACSKDIPVPENHLVTRPSESRPSSWWEKYKQRLRSVYPNRIYWVTAFIWGVWMLPFIDTSAAAVPVVGGLVIAYIVLGVLWPGAVLFYAWRQKCATGSWETTVIRGRPRRYLLQPLMILFLCASLFWAWQQTRCGIVTFDVDDPNFTVSLTASGGKSSQNYSAHFYPLRLRVGKYNWAVRHGQTSIASGQLEVTPGSRNSISARSPFPIGQADVVCLPGRWKFTYWFDQSMKVLSSTPLDVEEYVDIVGDRMRIHSSRLNEVLQSMQPASQAAGARNTPSQPAEYSITVLDSPAATRSWKRIDLSTGEAAKGTAKVFAQGVFTADKSRLSLCLAPVGADRPDGWSPSPGKESMTLQFERANDQVLLQGKWAPVSSVAPLISAKGGLQPVSESPQNGLVNATSQARYLIFEGNAFEDREIDPTPLAVDEGTFQVDSTQQPKRITLTTGPIQGTVRVYEGIYRIEGDVLTLQIGADGEIPSEFEPKSNGTSRYVEFKRVH
jgi:uncharacterized protein (TIGR03067 family)